MLPTPVKGKRTKGSRDVTGIGIASVSHKTAMHKPIIAVFQPSGDKPLGGVKTRKDNKIGVIKNPEICLKFNLETNFSPFTIPTAILSTANL